jgi:hypothetical protein
MNICNKNTPDRDVGSKALVAAVTIILGCCNEIFHCPLMLVCLVLGQKRGMCMNIIHPAGFIAANL